MGKELSIHKYIGTLTQYITLGTHASSCRLTTPPLVVHSKVEEFLYPVDLACLIDL